MAHTVMDVSADVVSIEDITIRGILAVETMPFYGFRCR